MKEDYSISVENMLRNMEDISVSACCRFLARNPSKDHVWILKENEKDFSAVIVSCKSTLVPVLCGLKEIPPAYFLQKLIKKKKIHSIQGLLEEVLVLEKEIENAGAKPVDIYDYYLMNLDTLPVKPASVYKNQNLVLRKPVLDDIDTLLPLREGYEKEEVLPSNSTFSPVVAKALLANFIKNDKILIAQLDGKIVGKIVVNGISFTRYQIGGVYVLPAYRGRGIAAIMTHEFCNSIINEGRGITLFVKKNNLPAFKLYTSLGFKIIGDYRITYY